MTEYFLIVDFGGGNAQLARVLDYTLEAAIKTAWLLFPDAIDIYEQGSK